ncbi:MAG: hypothetical protein LJE84_12390, partial [Gammaproteobacteria bacterium]|nr:hypothetical protein [Gammaproteobacteria bacterium]
LQVLAAFRDFLVAGRSGNQLGIGAKLDRIVEKFLDLANLEPPLLLALHQFADESAEVLVVVDRRRAIVRRAGRELLQASAAVSGGSLL